MKGIYSLLSHQLDSNTGRRHSRSIRDQESSCKTHYDFFRSHNLRSGRPLANLDYGLVDYRIHLPGTLRIRRSPAGICWQPFVRREVPSLNSTTPMGSIFATIAG